MKILALGDPHGKVPKNIPNADIILVTGDLGKADLARERFFKNQERKQQGVPELEENSAFIKKVHKEIFLSTIRVLKFLSKKAPDFFYSGKYWTFFKI